MSCAEDLKKKGYRLTPQRLMVIEELHAAEGHISAPDICQRVQAKYPWVNKSTIYRTLELLKELGLVTETEFGEDKLYYHQVEKGHHHHLICQKCGKIFDIAEDVFTPLEATLRQKYGFSADLKHLAIHGHCLKCRA
ncbi:MAG: Fur family transcriptional regulator [Dehalococcoidia bacterium]|nr:Fur family transcriptional regulator [Dehalococcoidia bacterium]